MPSYNPRKGKGRPDELDPCIAAEIRMKDAYNRKKLWIIIVLSIFVTLITLLLIGLGIYFFYSNDNTTIEKNNEKQISDNFEVHYEDLTPNNRLHGKTIAKENLPDNKFTDEFIPMTSASTQSAIESTLKPTSERIEVIPAGIHYPTVPTIPPKFRGTLKYQPVTTRPISTTQSTVIHPSTYSTKSDEIPDNLPSFSSLTDRKFDVIETEDVFDDCEKYRVNGHTTSGVYNIKIDDLEFRALCMMESDYAWMVLQRRTNEHLSFNKSFDEYANGFGTPTSDHWLGLEKVDAYSKRGQLQMRIELRDDLCTKGCSGYGSEQYWWGDWNFNIRSRSDGYRLSVEPMLRGNLSDSLKPNNNQAFSTYDVDNDMKPSVPCVFIKSFGPWWHKDCTWAALNGKYMKDNGQHRMYWYFYDGNKLKYIINPAKSLIKFRIKA